MECGLMDEMLTKQGVDGPPSLRRHRFTGAFV
jgi:hypothetical protein